MQRIFAPFFFVFYQTFHCKNNKAEGRKYVVPIPQVILGIFHILFLISTIELKIDRFM